MNLISQDERYLEEHEAFYRSTIIKFLGDLENWKYTTYQQPYEVAYNFGVEFYTFMKYLLQVRRKIPFEVYNLVNVI